MLAVNLYTGDNEAYLPHPTWGGNGSGPNGWAYAGSSGRRCDTPSHNWTGSTAMPTYAGSSNASGLAKQLEGQLESYRHGQLASYLGNNVNVLICPMDRAESAGSKRSLYMGRPIKITSYTWNGNVIRNWNGKGTPANGTYVNSGKTRKISDTDPGNIVQWETDERSPYWFNDAGNQPHEGISMRHGTNAAFKSGDTKDIGGSSTVGIISGAAINLNYKKFYDMARNANYINDLWWRGGSVRN